MEPPPEKCCRRCNGAILPGESLCPNCLLEAAAGKDSRSREEELFRQVLEHEPSDRLRFIETAARADAELGAALRQLLEGYHETGGDAPKPGATTADPPAGTGIPASALESEKPGARIAHFQLIRQVGEGGMGSVWEAEQLAPVRRTVALKLVKLGMDTREVVSRFQRERQTLAWLAHPNIAQVFEAGATALGRPYFVMEWVPGEPLTTWCSTHPCDLAARCRLFLEVCDAVEHAHLKGVIHRDLKPSNILVSDGRAKVIDFGIAKATEGSADAVLTRHTQIVGTPAYMSPEQARSAGRDVDTRTDVYALGVVLYELLTGVVPIDSDRLAQSSLVEMQQILLHEEPLPPSARVKEGSGKGAGTTLSAFPVDALRGDLDWVVMKAIRKDRDERYASVAALAEDLRRYLAGEPVSAAPPTLAYRTGKLVRRHLAQVAAVAMVAMAMIAGTAVSLWQAVRASRAEHQATVTVADMYARSGLAAATAGNPARAALWFANGAIIARKDPERREANRVRAEAWRREGHPPIRALQTGFAYVGEMEWHPLGRALILSEEGQRRALVWDLEAERAWDPGLPGPLERAVWHPSGKQLAVASGKELVVLEFPSGKELARRTGDRMDSLAFSPDGESIAVGGIPPDLWEWRTGARHALPPTRGSTHDIRFSRDGRWILLRWANMAGVCAVDQPGILAHPPATLKGFASVGFVGAGAEYFLGDESGAFEIHSSATGELRDQFTSAAPAAVPVTAASPDGRFIVRDGSQVIDRNTRQPLGFPRHRNVIGSLAFSPDGAWLASGGYDDALSLWAVPSGELVAQVGPHQSAVKQLRFSPDGTLLASAEAGLVRIWRLASVPPVRPVPVGAPTLVSFSRDGRRFVPSGLTYSRGSLTRTWMADVATGKHLGPDLVPGGVIMDAALGPDGTWLALVTSTTTHRSAADLTQDPGSGNLQFWDPVSGKPLGPPIPLPAEPRGLAIHPSGKVVGVCCNSGYGVEVDVATHQPKVLFHHRRNHAAQATLMNGRCSYSPDGRVFAVWGFLEYYHLWDREKGRELVEPYRFDATCFDLSFSGNVVGAVWVSRTNRLEFIDLNTGQPAAPAIVLSGWPFLGRFSDDGRLFLTTSRDRAGRVWDWRTGALVCPVLPHDDEVMAGAFVPGKPWVATGGHDGRIQFWDSRTGMPVAPPLQRNGLVLDLQTAPDGRTLTASGHLGDAIEFLDLKSLVPEPALELEDAQLLAEIEAGAQVHPGGDVVPLSTGEWVERWKRFRTRQPGYAGHRLVLDPEEQRVWHKSRIDSLAPANPGAAEWHRARVHAEH